MARLTDGAGLAGKRAIIVGGGDGVGRAVTLALAAAGVDIAVCDWKPEALAKTTAEAEAMGRTMLSASLDVLDPAALHRFIDAVDRAFDDVQILVNIAGGTRRRRFLDSTAELVERDMRLNFGYAVDTILRTIPMIQRGGQGGSIINFTTIEAERGAPGFSIYAGAKAALRNFSRSLAAELAPEHIRVNLIQPDSTPSETSHNSLGEQVLAELAKLPPETVAALTRMQVPMGEAPPAEALADAVLFLASDRSRYVTGISLPVDAGTSGAMGFVHWPFGDGMLPVPLAGTLSRLFAVDKPRW
jgi:NAD(P)-dependent dehydrogenase (short-subunit alcohol dehydrogenase family)